MVDNLDLGIEDLTDFEIIGSGGFATVYSARDTAFNRAVAIKVLRDDSQTIGARFERERNLMGQLSGHPNVITPYQHGLTKDGSIYLAMEYMAGGSLLDLILNDGPLEIDKAIELTLPVADALAYSHSHGILHKDVKPENILLSATGVPKLTDFGISSIREKTATQVSFTMAHTPPETFADGFDHRDERSDCYSLASTLYTAVTGGDAFHVDGQDSQVAYMRRIELHPVPLIGIDFLDEFFARAMAKDPAGRFSDADELADGIRRVRDQARAIGVTNASTPTTRVVPLVAPATHPNQAATTSPVGPAPVPLAAAQTTSDNQLSYQNTMSATPGQGQPQASGAPGTAASSARSPNILNLDRRKPVVVALVMLSCVLGLAVVGGLAWSQRSNEPPGSTTAIAGSETYSSIREVDFGNGPYFTDSEGNTITVGNGLFQDTERGLAVGVAAVSYGDLDGDGSEEAAVTTVESSDSTKTVGSNVFQLNSDGKVEGVDVTPLTAEPNRTILDAWITNQLLVVEYADASSSASPVATRNTFALSESGLSSVDQQTRTMEDVTATTTAVQFLPDTSSAVLVVDGDGEAIVNANRGQTIRIQGLGSVPAASQITLSIGEPPEQLATGVGQVATTVWEQTDYAINLEDLLEDEAELPFDLSMPSLFLVEITGDTVSASDVAAGADSTAAPDSTTTTSVSSTSASTSSSSSSSSTTTTTSISTSTTAPSSSTGSSSTTSTPEPDVASGAATLAGSHGLTLQWVLFSNEEPGSIDFVPIGDETYSVSGTHADTQAGSSVSVSGTVTKVSDLELSFSGTVSVTRPTANGGQPCVRNGDMTFLSTGGRQYWRMQGNQSPCDNAADYVDIYFN